MQKAFNSYLTIIIQIVYSSLFCGNINTPTENVNNSFSNGSKLKLYKVKLSDYLEAIDTLASLLTELEVERSQKYHFEKDKNRFIICRALLKISLAAHVKLPVSKLTIAIDSNKKPYLPSFPKLFFNVSHTATYALIAISEVLVGIDIEKIDREFDYSEAARTVFNNKDVAKMIQAEDQKQTFFTYWTRKEAIVKAIGTGITKNFREIPARDGEHKVLETYLSKTKKITVLSFNLEVDYMASIAIEGPTVPKSLYFSPLPRI